MKVLICHCEQCLASRKYSHLKKTHRIQTYENRAAKARVRELLKQVAIENAYEIQDKLDIRVSVDYYA